MDQMPRKIKGEDAFLMPADKYGKMVDKVLGESKGAKKGDFNEEPDTAPKAKKEPVKMAGGGYVRSADGCAKRGKTRGRMI